MKQHNRTRFVLEEDPTPSRSGARFLTLRRVLTFSPEEQQNAEMAEWNRQAIVSRGKARIINLYIPMPDGSTRQKPMVVKNGVIL
jgi:hypothetical protein